MSDLTKTVSRFSAILVALAVSSTAAGQDIREEVERPEPKLTKAPKLIKFVPAVYPDEARKKGVQGAVTMSIEIDAAGKVKQAKVLKSPDPSLSTAALVAVKEFLFSPAEVDGKPAPVLIQYSYNFILEIAFEPLLPLWMQARQGVKSKAPVAGRVRERGTRLPLSGIAIAIPDLGQEVKADDRGFFSFYNVPPGKYKLISTAAEYKRETVEVDVKKGEQSVVTFYLPRLVADPYETVVRGKRRKTVVTRVTLRQKELTTVPGTFGDPVRVVENLPGVARIPYVGGALLIRGAAPDDSGVYLDTTKIPQIYHFLGGPSVLNPQFLDRIDYYPGNPDVRYGRLLAGVVDVHTRNTFTRQWGGAVDINLLNASVFLKAPITEKVSVAGAVRRSYIDAIIPALFDAVGVEETTVAPVYYDYQLRVDVDLAGDDQLFILAFGSDDKIVVASNEEDSDVSISLDTHITFHRLLAGWRWQITDRLSSRLAPSFGVNYVTFDLGDTNLVSRVLAFTVREDLELKVNKRITLRTGVDIELLQGKIDAVFPVPSDFRNPGGPSGGRAGQFTEDSQEISLELWNFGLGLYVDSLLKLGDRLTLIPGVRLELLRYFGNTRLGADPRLTARFDLFKNTTIKAAAGHYSKAPEGNEANDTYGNPNLVLEHAIHLSVGFEQQILQALNLDAQFYYISRYDMAVASRTPLRFTNDGEGYSYGLEVILKHDVTKRLYGWLAYTLSFSRRQEVAGGEMVRTPFDQTHILTLVTSVKLGGGWEAGARFRLISGRPETEILGGFYDSDANIYARMLGEPRSVRLPMFHQLDLRVEKTWIFKLWKLSVYLDVQNVYNAENSEATLWDYRFEENGPLRGLPLLPTLGIKGSF